VKSTTYESYERVIRCHIKPELGRRKLKTLAPDHVQVLYQRKLDAGLTPGTVRLVHSVLSCALDQAVKWGTVPRNVCKATLPTGDGHSTPITWPGPRSSRFSRGPGCRT
jgi:integrase